MSRSNDDTTEQPHRLVTSFPGGAERVARHTEVSEPAPEHAGGRPAILRRKWFRELAVFLVLLVLAAGGYSYWHYRNLHPQTGDAYLNAHVVRIAPQVAGRVVDVPVRENGHVEKGQLLVAIDPAPFKVALDQAAAELEIARQAADASAAAVDASRAALKRRHAILDDVRTNTARTLALVEKGTLPQAAGDNATAALKEARLSVAVAEADLRRALKQLGAAGDDNARVRAAAAAVAKAHLDLSYTKIRAPAAGVVGKISIRPGAMVTAGEALFPLVEDHSFWVEANYKETDLERIRMGQAATVAIDIYPDKTFRAIVESLSPASGVAFSLLPPENATGNWVKVTQRFPVRLRILDTDPAHPLRIGASSVVTIDTTSLAS